jgi:FMN phosphatase YigB (HAD superfamily)
MRRRARRERLEVPQRWRRSAGAIAAGLRGILVRSGKYRSDTLEASAVSPTRIVDSIADVPGALTMS